MTDKWHNQSELTILYSDKIVQTPPFLTAVWLIAISTMMAIITATIVSVVLLEQCDCGASHLTAPPWRGWWWPSRWGRRAWPSARRGSETCGSAAARWDIWTTRPPCARGWRAPAGRRPRTALTASGGWEGRGGDGVSQRWVRSDSKLTSVTLLRLPSHVSLTYYPDLIFGICKAKFHTFFTNIICIFVQSINGSLKLQLYYRADM